MTLQQMLIILMPILEASTFFLLFEAFLARRKKWALWQILVGVFCLALMITLCNNLFYRSLANLIGMTAASAITARFLYNGPFSKIIMAAILGIAISISSENIVAYVIALFTGMSAPQALSHVFYWNLGMLGSKAFALAICNIIRVKSRAQQIIVKKYYWVLFFFLFSTITYVSFLIIEFDRMLGERVSDKGTFVAVIGLMFSAFFALYLYERLAVQSEALREQEQYEQHLKSQLKHLDELLIKQKALRGFKHDVSNQLVALKGYFASGNAVGGMRHVDSLLQRVSDIEAVIDTGNIALDAVLSNKQTIAEHKGIVFEHHICIAENLAVDPVDLCVIFGNALDNAIEACERLETADKRIVLDLRQEDSTLFCQLVNTAPPSSDHSLATSKPDKDNHGFGFANLTASLEKYGGAPLVVWENGWFTLSFMLFMSDAGP